MSFPLPDFAGGRITALLGPTNTGKTHRAVEQLLRHRSGMMGFPLRLLAREVYDRVSARAGEASVALITGEERRVPPGARYFLCTVEAMPLSKPVDFLAVDEIQLGAHPERGHIFTDRLLHARGVRETMLMGSDTVAGLLEQLVPTARIERQRRFSSLRYGGHRRLSALPARSAVVAFSAARVYELAERLRARHGGVAVVMGALSPRTRNAQVAMFQSGEVPVMVATDAIGMGLNMDIDHVAFAELHKFDGRATRVLGPAEVGQIAGRAGRYRKDGTFGPAGALGDFEPELVSAVEGHAFQPLRWLWYRNTDLDTRSLHALRESLRAPPPRRCLRLVRGAADELSLEKLAGIPAVTALLGGPDEVALLWEVCCVPDFRKTLTDDHIQLQAGIFRQLAGPRGRLDTDWLAERVRRLDRMDGDLDALMTRIAWIRTWTYISFRRDWLEDPRHWQERTRDIEERLSDALHDRLTARFVDRLAAARGGGARLDGLVELGDEGVLTALGQPVGQLEGFALRTAPGLRARDQVALHQRGRAILGRALERRVQRLVRDGDGAFSVDARGHIRWGGGPIAELIPGPSPARPGLRLLPSPLLGPGASARIERRLEAWVRDRVRSLARPLHGPARARLGPAGLELVEELEARLGVLRRAAVPAAALTERRALAALEVRVGTIAIYAAGLLGGATLSLRALLAHVHYAVRPIPRPPDGGAVSIPVDPSLPRGLYPAMGFVPLGPLAVRADVTERLAGRLRALGREGPFAPPAEAMSWLGCSREGLEGVIAALGYQAVEGGWQRAQGGRRRPRGRRPQGRRRR